ncbi:MAG TPA: 4-hydroxy-3-methylbut-2-enyl diphosphate reductase [Alphaproteobacteria bacterium]
MPKRPLTIMLAGPRGFCAGVERAIEIVECALEKFGPPVYVRHEIVHNRTVVEALEEKGAVFVEELGEVPPDMPVVFSAHGVPKSVPQEAERRNLFYVDATCPLVTKVHVEAERHFSENRQLILIGHAGHPEVVGTMGQLPEGAILLVENTQQAEKVEVRDPTNLAYVTQTTLSVDDCHDIVAVLTRRFPRIKVPRKEDICYATTNRQAAVKEVARSCDALIVLGAPNSSNSNRLREVALAAGCAKAILIQRAAELDLGWLEGVDRLGVTAGASAPELLVQQLIEACRERFDLRIEQVEVTRENVRFSLPRVLSA